MPSLQAGAGGAGAQVKGSRDREELGPAGLLGSLLGWPSALIPQSSKGRTGLILPTGGLSVTSCPSGSEDALPPALPSSWLLKGQAPVAWVPL